MKINPFVVWIIVVIIYIVGLVGFMTPDLTDLMIWLIPVNILFAFSLLLLGKAKSDRSFWMFFVVCFLFGYFIELLGTRTGVIFGDYSYGEGLGFSILNVPLMIGVNWFMMVYCSVSFVQEFFTSKVIQTILAPALMVTYDFFLEPFAVENNMWIWEGGIPLQNYIAWYVCGFLLCSLLIWRKQIINNRYAVGVFAIQFAFFIILYIRREILS